MGNSNSLFESIFKQKISASDTRDFLTRVTAEHPYFSPAHFFLLLNTEKGTPAYSQQAAKTAVLFNNAYWLQFQLQEELTIHEERESVMSDDKKKSLAGEENQLISHTQTEAPADNFDSSETTTATADNIAINEPVTIPGQPAILQQSEPVFTNIEEKDTGPVIDENHLSELEESLHEPVDPIILQQSEPIFINIEEKDTGPVIDENHLLELEESLNEPVDPVVLQQSEPVFNNIEEKDTGPVIDENHLSELEESLHEPVDPIILQRSEPVFTNIEEKDTGPVIDENHLSELEESLHQPGIDIISGQNRTDAVFKENENVPFINEEINLSEKVNEVAEENIFSATAENTSEVTEIPHSGHFNNQDSPLINEPDTEDEPVTGPETAPLNFKLNIDTSATTEDKITFEPLHTSDYFASLGIKLSNDVKPGDKLGKQLKSFTEWLKTMKKVHGDQLEPLSGQADLSIQKLAEQSNKDDTVATEAMADVLLMQGKREKAIEVYKKLSLLNPSKSVYFAAKIDQLKEH